MDRIVITVLAAIVVILTVLQKASSQLLGPSTAPKQIFLELLLLYRPRILAIAELLLRLIEAGGLLLIVRLLLHCIVDA